ncbi:hypothetical protein QMK92_29885, partial [Klebsiella pneumoniae]|uniref:hypothetical protein n=1 Tax=Klebsiella pneumoniae TaxID=573 RepID=UPI003A7F9D09
IRRSLVWWCKPLIPASGRQRHVDIRSEFQDIQSHLGGSCVKKRKEEGRKEGRKERRKEGKERKEGNMVHRYDVSFQAYSGIQHVRAACTCRKRMITSVKVDLSSW